MKSKTMLPVLMILVAMSAAVTWAAPSPGTYGSTDVGGSVFPGRMTQSEDASLGLKPGAGDVFNWASWDGGVLGSQWSVTCAVQYVPQVRKENMDADGDGIVSLTNTFFGGTFLLSSIGPWGGGAPSLGKIGRTDFSVQTTYMGFKPTSEEMVVSSRGLDRFGRTIVFTSTRCLAWGDVADGLPADFPKLLDMACQAMRKDGYWWEAGDVTIQIMKPSTSGITITPASAVRDNQAPDRSTSWGSVKILYR